MHNPCRYCLKGRPHAFLHGHKTCNDYFETLRRISHGKRSGPGINEGLLALNNYSRLLKGKEPRKPEKESGMDPETRDPEIDLSRLPLLVHDDRQVSQPRKITKGAKIEARYVCLDSPERKVCRLSFAPV
jgi:hypothetical protein